VLHGVFSGDPVLLKPSADEILELCGFSFRERRQFRHTVLFDTAGCLIILNMKHTSPLPDPALDVERHFRYDDVAERWNVSPAFVRKLVLRREISFVRAGTAILIPESAMREYLARNHVPARERMA